MYAFITQKVCWWHCWYLKKVFSSRRRLISRSSSGSLATSDFMFFTITESCSWRAKRLSNSCKRTVHIRGSKAQIRQFLDVKYKLSVFLFFTDLVLNSSISDIPQCSTHHRNWRIRLKHKYLHLEFTLCAGGMRWMQILVPLTDILELPISIRWKTQCICIK